MQGLESLARPSDTQTSKKKGHSLPSQSSVVLEIRGEGRGGSGLRMTYCPIMRRITVWCPNLCLGLAGRGSPSLTTVSACESRDKGQHREASVNIA
ncbi:hypothetical protein E2C01_028337 [Portunus trituberculatus]|uniref:Uncharacterized protein n=1 Tax=Portunus trituberculatus TaxID=210409 RepID=A0A5B7EPR3_PORTR|nr:hypothetical protein [Portunus trituberculatus]